MELPQQNQHQHVLDRKTSGPNGPGFATSSFSTTLQPGNNMKQSFSLFAGCTTTNQEDTLESIPENFKDSGDLDLFIFTFLW